jgi:hypothetical protein
MMKWTQQQFLARAAFIKKQIEKWKGIPAYKDTLEMELFALQLAAEMAPLVPTEANNGAERQ